MTVRKPAVAGSFYPAQPDRLRRQIEELLAEAEPAPKITPKALIAPHAGYIYSGLPAATAFATLRDSAQTFVRIVLIGPAHYVAIRGVALPTADVFETPAAIENGDWASLGPGQACGYLPIAGLLIEATRRNLKARRLSLCNSGDTAGPRDQVVGYGAWMFG